ncbi:hypothetical protein GIB67_021029 [Kingdonia uniflora]|uniref:RNase H type-1 domain-containing protein n=1 Tax=Kingdonia uniflora TaxID=39325 RepID=A0A7J7N777_9MAGN|nr:hypothetical protein GIB67_021029 [Kingdonia uniflora]
MAMANQLLNQALHNDEELWQQKAKINWLKSRDRNTAYFQALTRIKRNKSLIHAHQNEDGRLLEDRDEIKAHIVNFFSEKFTFKDHPKSYLETSRQVFSAEKNKLYLGAMNNVKKQKVKDIFGFNEGCLPTTYLCILLVQGRVTKEILRPLVDKIKKRATGWAGNLLSLQGGAVLIQSVLSSISIFSMGIYKWPTSVIKEGKRILQNFLWSREPESKKACVVAWDKVCKPFKEGGINLRPLKEINQSLMMKLTWNFLNPKDEWAEFMRVKFIAKAGNFSTITKGFSIWAGVRGALKDVSAHSGWVIGDGDCIDLWRDNWCSPLSLKDMINDDAIPWSDLKAKVSYIITEGKWSIPNNLQLIFDRFGVDIHTIKINHHKPDRRVWKPDLIGNFSVKGAFDSIQNKGQPNWWFKILFRRAIHHRLSIWGWRLCHGKLPTYDNVQKKGITLVSRCSLCSNNFESIHHLFWDYSFSIFLWTWLEDLFKVQILDKNLKRFPEVGESMSPYLKDLWIGTIWGGTNLIWLAQNNNTFEEQNFSLDQEKRKWYKQLHETTLLSQGCMNNSLADLSILHKIGVLLHSGKQLKVSSNFWELPNHDEIKINTDGAARGNPGKGGIGCIFRDSEGKVLGSLVQGLGLVSNYTAECKTIIKGVKLAASNGWLIAWVESDSKSAVKAFNSDNIPWTLEA